MHIYVYVRRYISMSITCVVLSTCMYVSKYLCMYVSIYLCMYLSIFVCMYERMYAYKYVNM